MGLTNESIERGMQDASLQGNIASQLRGSLKQDKKMKEKRHCLGLLPQLMKYMLQQGDRHSTYDQSRQGTGSE